MWSNTELENLLEKELHSCFDDQKAKSFCSLYQTAKEYLCNNIYSEIKGIEPSLTDHSERHIKNVLEKAWQLINKKNDCFNVIEIYLLCTCILFHDVGNIHGRAGHNTKVADIYNKIRNGNSFCNQERQLLLRVVRAHCGKSKRGDKDTLIDVDESSNLFDHHIRLRELAAILRFADELAEGPQRTSQYIIEKRIIDDSAILYHKYASITEVHVDDGNGRIVLSYNIDYPINELPLKDLLRFVYSRILKMDMERRYCKYYAPTLDKFKKTEASINFTIKGDLCDYDLPKICLEDKYGLVEEEVENLIDSIPALNVDTIDNKLQYIAQNKSNI